VNELAPIIVNCDVSDDLIASIAVSIPTSAIIPKAIIHIVRTALTLFDLIALADILKFSLNMLIFILQIFKRMYQKPFLTAKFNRISKRLRVKALIITTLRSLHNPDSYRDLAYSAVKGYYLMIHRYIEAIKVIYFLIILFLFDRVIKCQGSVLRYSQYNPARPDLIAVQAQDPCFIKFFP